ncbi:hypothetical protein HY29_02810 [Hyphomonas beringensis]|uniref:DUF817 domain-containing protein n=1 Tax=Hyphomonas beringensis TaxID=1280946 RepID=A0A062U126_9PROT|nr:DUF817 domain-containing protein [Hyphomonas beringensis]KCZ54016.1 hypothetical protein HY29_02810 [Hyphomonas beringensis]
MTRTGPTSARARTYLHAARAALHARFVKGPWSQAAFEFVTFGIKQGWACLFGGLMLGLLLGTFLWYPDAAPLARYDVLVLGAVGIQIMMLWTGLETWEEAKIIFVFHIVGTVMELFKTAHGSWIYPEASLLRIGAVPLFTGFMYAAVGSYIARVWRIFDFQFDRFPPLWLQGVLAAAIYVNFFAHHWLPDVRIALFIATALIYGPCLIWFRADETQRPMPLVIGFLLVALFIWFAENLGTFARAWAYPGQEHGWHMVSLSKLGSWYLLMIISFVLVAAIHKGARRVPGGPSDEDPEAARREPGRDRLPHL